MEPQTEPPAKHTEKLSPRKKPLRRKPGSFKDRPLIIDQSSGPVRIDTEQKDGHCFVKFTSLCPPECECGGEHCGCP